MPNFTPKKLLLEETLGEKLRQRRHYKNLKIEDIAKIINIRAEYLIALEGERFDNLPTGLYGKKFLKQYANFLDIKLSELSQDWERQLSEQNSQNPFSQKIVKARKLIVFPKIIRNVLIGLTVLVCFSYLIFYFKNIISPPPLTITKPTKNFLTTSNSLVISGWTDSNARVTINNENIITQKGHFSKTINLKMGLNNLIIRAQKKYSQAQVITREILVE